MVLGLAQDVNINNQWTLRVPLAATELILFEHDVFPVDLTLHVCADMLTRSARDVLCLRRA
jgi:hypothetical protein